MQNKPFSATSIPIQNASFCVLKCRCVSWRFLKHQRFKPLPVPRRSPIFILIFFAMYWLILSFTYGGLSFDWVFSFLRICGFWVHSLKAVFTIVCLQVRVAQTAAADPFQAERDAWAEWMTSANNQVPAPRYREFQQETFTTFMKYVPLMPGT